MADSDDPLERFVEAQSRGVHERALAELTAGRKVGHWMWFELPQVAGLGRSATAQRYAVPGLDGPDGARAYLAHPVLGPRLHECTGALLGLDSADPVAVMGDVDALKLRSSMTLFARASAGDPTFRAVLAQYFDGHEDPATLALLA